MAKSVKSESGDVGGVGEFSRPLDVSTLSPRGHDESIKPRDAERDALAKRLGVRAIHALSAQIHAQPIAGGAVQISGSFTSTIEQDCVVTLEPMRSQLDGSISVTFVPAATIAEDDDELAPDADDVDVMHDAIIDLGDVVVQHLALAIDPYPRKPGASFAGLAAPGEAAAVERPSPFAGLAKLKSRNQTK